LQAHAQTAIDRASGALDSATDATVRTFQDARDSARLKSISAVDKATTTATAIGDRIAGAAGDAKEAITQTTSNITGQANDLAQQARAAVTGTWTKTPC